MKVKKYQLILCLWVIITGGIVFIFFREKLEKNPNALKFENHQFNDSIKENMVIDYYFKIGNKPTIKIQILCLYSILKMKKKLGL